ncbi:MAG: LamG-like jellyroll fold domain-containing protein [Prolixibacteraceae bacterium]
MIKSIGFIFLIFLVYSLNAQQLAFPGATGFGRFATGGRGGAVVHVTNLNDSGSGSFRDAVSQPNRTVVFDVAGIINIQSRIVFSKNLTIAGQTAPGEGVVVYGDGVSFSGADNTICRYMRFRMGAVGSSGKDAAGIANGKDMIFDHVSVTWGRDETFSISWDDKGTVPTNITIQNSIIGQGLQTHSAGGLIQTIGGVTLFRNLYIDNHTRNPKVKGLNQYVNNVVYNWGGGGCYILGDSEGTSWATIVNNYFIEGPNTSVSTYSRANENFQLYAEGNYEDATLDGNLNGHLSQKSDYGPALWVEDPSFWEAIPAGDANKIPQMHPVIDELMTAEEAYAWIVDNVGCTLPVRDQVDLFLIDELTSLGKKGFIISNEKELPTGGPGTIFVGEKLSDTDNDGMPDSWEVLNGTNKSVNDAAIIGADGYSNIEKYINSITEPIAFLRFPVNISATAKTTNSITLQWTNLDDDLDAIILEYGVKENFTNKITLGGTSSTTVVNGLDPSTKYYFRLQSVRGNQSSPYSDIYSMVTNGAVIAPIDCEDPEPEDGASLDQNKNIILSWQNRTGVMAGALFYDLFLGKSETNMEMVVSQTNKNIYQIEELEENTTYYWRVQTTNLLGVNEGAVWSFTTGTAIIRNRILYLPFDEKSGNVAFDKIDGNNATAVSFTPQWNAGIIDTAIFFPGTPANSYLEVDYSEKLFFEDQSFTISMWFKSPGGIPDSYLLHKGMHDNTNNGNGRWFGIQYKSDELYFSVDDNATKSMATVANAQVWFNNEWHHLACIRDKENSALKIFVDGQLQKEAVDNTGAIGETGKLIIGNRNGYFDNPYVGGIDDLILYDEALTADEIKDIYDDAFIVEDTTSNTNLVTDLANRQINVYPNPFSEYLMVQLPNNYTDKTTVNICSSLGTMVRSQQFDLNNGSTIQLNQLGELAAGIYFCTVTNQAGSTIKKIIK